MTHAAEARVGVSGDGAAGHADEESPLDESSHLTASPPRASSPPPAHEPVVVAQPAAVLPEITATEIIVVVAREEAADAQTESEGLCSAGLLPGGDHEAVAEEERVSTATVGFLAFKRHLAALLEVRPRIAQPQPTPILRWTCTLAHFP